MASFLEAVSIVAALKAILAPKCEEAMQPRGQMRIRSVPDPRWRWRQRCQGSVYHTDCQMGLKSKRSRFVVASGDGGFTGAIDGQDRGTLCRMMFICA